MVSREITGDNETRVDHWRFMSVANIIFHSFTRRRWREINHNVVLFFLEHLQCRETLPLGDADWRSRVELSATINEKLAKTCRIAHYFPLMRI